MRAAGPALAVLACGRIASANTDPAEPPPDPRAQSSAEEANLESNAPRSGFTTSASLGAAMMVGGDGGVGRGGMLSLRIGEVATPNTIITFELTGGSALHDLGQTTLHNDDVNVLAGAQYYFTPVLWLRGAAGWGVYTRRDSMGTHTFNGPAAGFSVGLDLFTRHYFRIGLEALSIGKVARDGVHTTSGFCLGFSYY